jgi:uncharacterized protein YndB with AHSA1/START domain
MAATAEAASAAGERELVVTRIFNAPRGVVFKAWIEPEHLARWWGPQGFTLVSCKAEVRPRGAWHRTMRAPDGSLIRKHGVYREVVAPERLVFTYVSDGADGNPGPATLVMVTFADDGGKTKLTLRQTLFASAASRDAHQIGWTSCLERFAEYLASPSMSGR